MSGNYPADVINQALDLAGVDFTIGEPTEGTRPAQVALRHYRQCLRELLRSAHWDFSRVQVPLVMLADATGQTEGVGTNVPQPWVYEYAYPANCMKARFVPANYLNPNAVPAGNISVSTTVPQTSVPTQPPWGVGMRLVPAPFLISMDSNYPVDPDSNWLDIQGESPAGRVVILSNVNQAQVVMTQYVPFPNMWDAQFRGALVAFLASRIAMPLHQDKVLGMKMETQRFQIAKDAVRQARITNGNEAGWPQTTDQWADWSRARWAGGGYNWSAPWNAGWGMWGMGGMGACSGGFMSYGFDQSVF